ncbi:endopeptidase La [Gracilinema caldarium]|uniref:Lon protease n=1 Tax=Gracilinema caldarium (strain ATCC 51460 / DSM 7334 / H1) TaxID=744872 RepID=F8EZ24_GRAC1|nr:endopeptidase La [Gracilinema caldarium]AEJ19255.1 anti-sigma H sporulation factor, LonB [Gracilinema caldarium DSM 7334]
MSLLSAFKSRNSKDELPLMPVREFVVFPHTMIPLFITYPAGIKALEEALKRDQRLFAACRKDTTNDEDTYPTGTVAHIVQQLKLPDGSYRVVLHGEYRGRIGTSSLLDQVRLVTVQPIQGIPVLEGESAEIEALMRAVQRSFNQFAELSKKISTEVLAAVERAENAEKLCNVAANALPIKIEKKLELLEIDDSKKRLQTLLEHLELENEIIALQRKITGKVKSRMEKTQREYILNEQLKEINKELGRDTGEDEFTEIEKALEAKNPPEEVLSKAKKELNRLKKLQSLSPEAGVLRTYLEWIIDLPWNEATTDSTDLALAEEILNRDHYDMKKPKERIIEYLAVRQLTSQIKGPILCFVGPPGTGKTSLGKSVARALGRNFVRISLGGVRDEAEIRGHRKTYVGALPGKIIQSMRRAKSINPVFLLDEIDKLSSDFRGDPASALLEVLDPEQNSTFTDHYLEVPYDLSKVLFIATANSLHTIPHPLLDRMEVIDIPGYGEGEKLQIAKRFLIPKQLEEHGLAQASVKFQDEAIRDIIRYRTMESGVRGLEREIAHCIRKLAKSAVEQGYGKEKAIGDFKKTIRLTTLDTLLGKRKYKHDVVYKEQRIGVCYGLAWTETGGTILPIETVTFEGSGELIMTGNLGDVMKESARTALSYLRSISPKITLAIEDIGKTDFHIHVPEGAIPKDGPSAGITLAVSLLSTLSQRPVKGGFAMTGELTLTGRVLPIGGLKEKLLAAIRNGLTDVIIPKGNMDDLEELDRDIREALIIHSIEQATEAFELLFEPSIFT